MRGRHGVAITAALLTICLCVPASAQRREGKSSSAVSVKLPVRATFGKKTVAAKTYRLNVRGGRLSLVDPTTMVAVVTMETTVSDTGKSVDPPRVTVQHTKSKVTITLHSRTKVYKAQGTPASGDSGKTPVQIALKGKSETALTKGIPEEKTERELVINALGRYASSVKHCADKARKFRWESGDPRYVRCACPLTAKWRLPKVTKDMRVHYVLAKGRSGLSLTVGPKGRAKDCDVWVGKEPPKPKEEEVATATEGADPAEPSQDKGQEKGQEEGK